MSMEMPSQQVEKPTIADFVAGLESAEREEEEMLHRYEELIHSGAWRDDQRLRIILEGVAKLHDEAFGPDAVELAPERWLAFMKLRQQSHHATNVDFRNRAMENPVPSPEECSMLTFYEELEPEVRDAVFALHRKGYAPTVSGFFPRGYQMIRFEISNGLLPQLPDNLVHSLQEQYEISIKQEADAIVYLSSDPLTSEEMREIWQKIADAFPDTGKPASPISGYQSDRWKSLFQS